jgi:DNA mismatch repair ATPase MutS
MSGKSTFLRTLGVNAVLSFMGGPVIAHELTIPLCTLGTSIRVSDSLKSGISHFYAEVQKLASVVQASQKNDTIVLFLLDEVLHGTNSRERQIGARWVLAELLARHAFGVITTHDMELCRLPDELMRSVRQHHFREDARDGKMTFDYLLREGPVTSGNALRLMRQVGLAVPINGEDSGTSLL